MKFNELSKENINYIKKVYLNKNMSWDDRMKLLQDYLKKSERTIRRWLVKLGIKERQNIEESEQYKDAKSRKYDKTKKRFLITWAQNNTPINKSFFDNIKAYAKFLDADIHVIAGRYKNPTSIFVDKKFDVWDNAIVDYLDAGRHNVHKYVSIMSDVKIQPTAVNPLTGLDAISGINSCVFGSPKVHMKVLAALEGHKPKMMLTTGAVTKSNYTDSKAGKKGEFHHTFGFVIVEIKNKEKFFARQVTASNNGEFYDLFYHVKDKHVEEINEIEVAVLGDIHYEEHDDIVLNKTVEILDKLKPNHTILHDVFDGYSISHHHEKDPILQYKKEKENKNSLKGEIERMLEWVNSMRKYNLVVVRSNHDDFVDRWIINGDWKKNIKNSLEYMEYAKILLEGKADKGIIPYIIEQNFNNVKTLGRMDSYKVKGWELGVHGDFGQNGSFGSLAHFRNLNTKIVVGHYHSPARLDGALSVGTSTKLRLGYNLGASTWLNSHVIIHKDGKAQHINFIDGDYTTLK